MMDSNLLLCRPGFESDCAAEMEALSRGAGLSGYARAEQDQGFLIWHTPQQDARRLTPARSVFARTGWPLLTAFGPLPEDRIQALLSLLREVEPVNELRLEHPDTNEGRGLHPFLKRFRRPLEAALTRQGLLANGTSGRCLHLFFVDSRHGYVGISEDFGAGPWTNGIPRLKLSGEAPSRSALKIEEACRRLMDEREYAYWLRPDRAAVDLGAAPGGWSWFLARRGLRVTAVDHGQLAHGLEASYPVTRVAADAFTWRPPAAVDWLVCDIVDKPARTRALMEAWLSRGWARLALFNLKLPMKKRYAQVAHLQEQLLAGLASTGSNLGIRAAHLYHDRDEVTVLVLPGDADASGHQHGDALGRG